MTTPALPPLLTGHPVPRDAFGAATALALRGGDPGTLVYAQTDAAVDLAVILAPEMPLARALDAMLALQLATGDAIGALSPPEVAVQIAPPAGLVVNGGSCGGFRAAAPVAMPEVEPGWLTLGLWLAVMTRSTDPGADPDHTTLHDEGCGDLTVPHLIESLARHFLVWIDRLADEGRAPLVAAWQLRLIDPTAPDFLPILERP